MRRRSPAPAINYVGWAYENGVDVEQNYDEALAWYRRGRLRGRRRDLVPQNTTEGPRWLQQAANLGQPDAQKILKDNRVPW